MWAHHGEEHEGCVIELRDALDRELLDLERSKINIHNSDYLIPFDVSYSDIRPKIFDENGNSNTEKTGFNSCFIKAKAWEYEQEVRVVKAKPEGIYPFPLEQIVAIYLGMKANLKTKKEIYELVKRINNDKKLSIKRGAYKSACRQSDWQQSGAWHCRGDLPGNFVKSAR